MKIDKEYYETKEYKGEKVFTLEKINEKISAYADGQYFAVWFENETLEKIGVINESDIRTSWNRYFTATMMYGWDGKKNTKKEFVKTLATRADYTTAVALLKEAYYNTIKA